MHRLFFILILFTASHTHAQSVEGCYEGIALQEAVSRYNAISPSMIYKTIDEVAPGAALLKVTFCYSPKGQNYTITVLKENGEVVKFILDAKTGAVMK